MKLIFMYIFAFFISSPRNVSPITPYKLPFQIHGFCIYRTYTPRIKSFYCSSVFSLNYK